MTNPFETIDARLSNIENLLLDLKHFRNGNTPESDQWLDLNGLCNYHPDKPAKPTVYAYVQNRTIPFYRKGKKLFFLKSEIDAWLKSSRRKTSVEISAEVDLYFTNSN
jgi:excisionase family DNA binding protein